MSLLLALCAFAHAEGAGQPQGDRARAAAEYLDAGDRFFEQGEYDIAAASYSKAIEVAPDLSGSVRIRFQKSCVKPRND